MPAPEPFSALLLAGGRSTRMGRDKALLLHPVSGQPLLAHQATLLRSLPGCAELLVSAPADRGYELAGPLAGARLVTDAAPDCGPLAGITAGLAAANSPRLLVLAVDLPFVTTAYLERLVSATAVPRHPDGAFEPLCAMYPISSDSRAAFAAALASRELSLQRLIAAACDAGWMRSLLIPSSDSRCFSNWNTPDDLGPVTA